MTFAVVDACIHHRWESSTEEDVLQYLPREWRDYVGRPESLPGGAGARQVLPTVRHSNPLGDGTAAAPAQAGYRSATSAERLGEEWLDPHDVTRALLLHDRAMFAPASANPFLARVFIRALNDWTVDAWLDRDRRLHSVVVVNTQEATDGAAEIRRIGANSQIAGALLAAFPNGRLAGHPMYFPIYEAAAELDLPIVLHRGGDNLLTPTGTAGGTPLTFGEYVALAPMAMMSHLLSLIANGVLLKYPTLRIYVVGAGVSWVAGFLRRLEVSWLAFRREVPWMTEPPSETFYRQVRICTYGLERRAKPEMLERIFAQEIALDELLVYGSGYPSWDTTLPSELQAILPTPWHEPVFATNGARWLRWDARPRIPDEASATRQKA